MRQRRSRSSITPLEGRGHQIPHATERDREIFRILDPNTGHRFLPSTWIHAHFPTSWVNSIVDRLGYLKEAGNEFLRWAPQPLNIPGLLNRHGVYELAPRGAQSIGISIPKFRTQEHAHEFLNCLVDCSFKLAARDAGVEYLVNDPLRIKMTVDVLVPDGRPFTITANGRTTFFPGKEIDRNTEALTSSKLKTTSIAKKFALYHEFMKTRRYEEFGFHNALIPIMTVSEGRMRSMMRLVEVEYGPTPWLLFAYTKDWAHEPRFPEPNGDLANQPWLRVGCPPLKLIGGST